MKKTKAIEDRLTALRFQEVNGNESLHRENDELFRHALMPLLWDGDTLLGIAKALWCSAFCSGENEQAPYHLYDDSRIKLTCGHFSKHVQCVLLGLDVGGMLLCYERCPVRDSLLCCEEASGKKRKNFYWCQQDYPNFFKAFLRNEKLVEAFVRPLFFNPSTPEEKEEF